MTSISPPGDRHEQPPARRREVRALSENLDAIRRWEREALHSRSGAQRISDWITRTAARGPVLAAHVVWFVGWILANEGVIPGVPAFDPYPYSFLTMTVSLEAIFLSLFVLASQNSLAQQADKRAHLDLQIDLLAEREMTVVLRLLQDIATALDVRTSVTADQIRDLAKKTDIHDLATDIEDIASEAEGEMSAAPSKGDDRQR